MTDKFIKTIRLVRDGNNIESKMIDQMDDAKDIHGKQMKLLRRWMRGGYVLESLGHGFLVSMLAQVEAGLTQEMTEAETAHFIKELIVRTMWMEEKKSLPVNNNHADPQVPVSQDITVAQVAPAVPAFTAEPVAHTVATSISQLPGFDQDDKEDDFELDLG